MATKALQCASRFALLSVEDDDSDDSNSKGKQKTQKSAQQTSSAKKRNKKKKKIEEGKEKDELRSLAFGGKSSGKKSQQGSAGSSHSGQVPEEQWQQWKQLDVELTAEVYEKDLQQALLQSKVEYEQNLQLPNNDDITDTSRSIKDKKKTTKKKNVMSLEEFNNLGTGELDVHSTENSDVPSNKTPRVTASKSTTDSDKFFEQVSEDTNKILHREKIQDEYRKQYVVENVRSAQYQKELDKKDKEITMLRASMKNLEDELKQVKKRNKQLCVILAQGEMKEKADVLLQVDELTQIKDELTLQVSELTGELEKERSKVHAIKTELDKIKSAKHK